ncbi:MAG: 2'-5' RNA ligase family protein [Marmoricola sp.]
MSTIGVSIAVPEPCGARLQDYRVALGDEPARGIPTHVTLLPPFELDDSHLAEVDGHLGEAARSAEPFRVHLRGTGTFRPVSPVVFVVVVEGISACEQLAGRIRTGPLSVQPRFPYHPHVTVAHELDDTLLDKAFVDLADFDCVFRADRFHLYVHEGEAGWRPVRSFELGAGG